MKKIKSHAWLLLREILALPLLIIAFLSPKDKKLWILGAWHGDRYADSPKYLLEYIKNNEPDLRPVWLGRNKKMIKSLRRQGIEAYEAYSFRGIITSLRAGIHWVSHNAGDVNAHTIGRAYLIKITHGTPIKRVGFDAVDRRYGKLTKFYDGWIRRWFPRNRKPTCLIAGSEYGANRLASSFKLPPDEVKVLGYPRWTPLAVSQEEARAKLGLKPLGEQKIILYAPTRRVQGLSSRSVEMGDGLEELTSWLEREKITLMLRAHASSALSFNGGMANRNHNNIVNAGSDVFPDVNELLPAVDVLITDYSSIACDFAVMRRPVIIMAPDLELYRNSDVGLYPDFVDTAPSEILKCWKDLPRAFEFLNDAHGKAAQERFFGLHGGCQGSQASKNCVEFGRTLLN